MVDLRIALSTHDQSSSSSTVCGKRNLPLAMAKKLKKLNNNEKKQWSGGTKQSHKKIQYNYICSFRAVNCNKFFQALSGINLAGIPVPLETIGARKF